jgi:hypothetical protein
VLVPFCLGCFLVLGVGIVALGGVGLWWLLRDSPAGTSSPSTPASKPSGETKQDETKKGGEERWTVLFRSSNPALWNSASKGNDYAIPLKQAPAVIRFLRLRRMNTGEQLIVPLQRHQLDRANLPTGPKGRSWNGSAKLDWGGQHLGIAQPPRMNFPIPNGTITVLNEGWDGWSGSGFGHKAFVNDVQYYCWKGQQIDRTAFEIAVTDQPLSDEEKRFLVTD